MRSTTGTRGNLELNLPDGKSSTSERLIDRRPKLGFDPYVWACLCLGLCLFQPLFAGGLPQAPDAILHFFRAVIWRSAWDQGVVWPRWDTLFYQGYGYPLFNFYGPLLYLGTALLSYLLPNVETAFKGVLLISCLSYPVGMYLWTRTFLGPRGAIVAAAAYTFATYRFRELYFLGGYAQFLAWGMFPWILHFLAQLARTKARGYFLGAAVTLAALILSHNISAMLFAPVLLCYAAGLAVAYARQRAWPMLVGAITCGIGLAAIFWIPALGEANFTDVKALTQGVWDVQANFLQLSDLLATTPVLDNRAVNPLVPFSFGQLHLLLAALGVLRLLDPRLSRSRQMYAGFAGIGLLISTFLMLPGSLPVWRLVPMLSFTEYPWRLYGLAFLFSSLLAGLAFTWLERLPRVQIAATAVGVAALILVVGVYQFPRPFLTIPDTQASYLNFENAFRSMGTTAAGEYLSQWTKVVPGVPALRSDMTRMALVDPGTGQSGTVLAAGPESLKLHVKLPAAASITVAQFFFPGWTASVDGVPTALGPAEPSGCIQLMVPEGDHDIALVFRDTPLRTGAKIVTLAALLMTGWITLRRHPAGAPVPLTRPAFAYEVPALVAVIAGLLILKVVWVGPHTGLLRFESPAGAAEPAQRHLTSTIADQVALLGYDLDRRSVAQGDELHIRLYWQPLQPLEQDYASYVQLIGGPQTQSYGTSDHQHPGNIPTHTWPTERYIIDDHYLRVGSDTPPVPFRLQVGLYKLDDGERLGSAELPERVYVIPQHPLQASDISGGSPVQFGSTIRLLGSRAVTEDAVTTITLYWQTSTRPAQDYQVFVQLVDKSGSIVAQADDAPVQGLYPTSLWQPGQIIADVHRAQTPAGSRPAQALVGLYNLSTMERLPAVQQDGRLRQNNAVVIPLSQPNG